MTPDSPDDATLRGLGPRSRLLLASIGITSGASLRARDPFAVYAALRAADAAVSLNMLYALIGAIEDRDWRDVARNDRTRILLALDALGIAPD
ncbi:MAG: TfoX/Sxy family DNA transformation protein [Burkholderiales bacterium]|nr:TfoX/Sxy family DNA transformation protein [Burkholderiales bacterium]